MASNSKRLPAGWVEAPLAELIRPRGDKVSPAAFPNARFVGMDHVESQTTNIIGAVPANTMKSNAARFLAGDVLYGRLRPYLNKVARPTFDGLASAEFLVFPRDGVIRPSFLKYRLNAADFVSFACHLDEGDRPRVSFDQIGRFPVMLPPAKEQDRIVAMIEELFSELDNGTENLKRASDKLYGYRQAVLTKAFSGELSREWPLERNGRCDWQTVTLGSVLSLVTSGSRGWASYYAEQGDIFIRAQNLKSDRLLLDDAAFVRLPKKTAEGTRTRVQAGDVLVTITGANVTKTGFVKQDIGTAYVSQHVALARSSDAILPEYLYWFLVAESGGRKQLQAAAYGAGKPGLNLENIRSVSVPLPNLAEQHEIVAWINRLLSLADRAKTDIDAGLQQAEVLRQAILKAAFSGNLVEQAPDDEPASALLARIAAERNANNNNSKRKTGI